MFSAQGRLIRVKLLGFRMSPYPVACWNSLLLKVTQFHRSVSSLNFVLSFEIPVTVAWILQVLCSRELSVFSILQV